jgi:hypothetical protein
MTDTKTKDSQSAQQGDRLPCRGCPASCPHYEDCDGKPWRMDAEVVTPAHDN